MAAPYWGQLPGPKASSRRNSADHAATSTERRQSSDGAPQPRSKANRVSVQTTASSQVPTESTQSPFVSPTGSSFAGQGLAPRPPSLPYGANSYPPELLENRRRRRSKNQDQDQQYAPSPLPAAPDVPKAPPSSYKHPFGNGGLPYTYAASGGGPSRPNRSMNSSGADYVKGPASDRRDDDKARRNGHEPTAVRTTALRNGVNGDHQRRSSEVDGTQGRKRASLEPDRRKFAKDRSPLQRLELTLDSITKEEKRARVEAAERAARGKLADAANQQPENPTPTRPQPPQQPQQQVRFRERRPSVGQEAARPVIRQPPPPAAQQGPGPLSQNPPEEGRLYGAVGERRARIQPAEDELVSTSAPAPKSAAAQPLESTVVEVASGIPQRNLSFRERAAQTDLKIPAGVEPELAEQKSPPATSPAGSFSLTRNGSNKLRKNPPASKGSSKDRTATGRAEDDNPGDPWFQNLKQLDVEEKYPMMDRYPAVPANGTATSESRLPGRSAPSGVKTGSVRVVAPDEETPEPVRPVEARQVEARVPPGLQGSLRAQPNVITPAQPVVSQPPMRAASQRKADQVLGRGPVQGEHISTNGNAHRNPSVASARVPAAATVAAAAGAVAATANPRHPAEKAQYSEDGTDEEYGNGLDDLAVRHRYGPGQGIFQPTEYLDEWRKATIGTLSGSLLDLSNSAVPSAEAENDQAWWETPPSQRRGSISSRPKKAEAFDGEYDDTHAPTRFKPPLYLKCGPLLRFCGIRNERISSRSARNGAAAEREIWRGSVMIVTTDDDSSYDIAPTLRLFVQPVELLSPPPAIIEGEEVLPPEHVDPIAGHPKLGRKGETLYVRPVDYLPEGKDVSKDETGHGLFEKTQGTDPPGSFTVRRKRVGIDGEKVSKYKDVRGFRLHTERGYTFWRFNIEVELRETQQRIAYRINRGPAMGFWVPARGQSMNIMFHSCNGFSLSVDPDNFTGPDPMWRDVLNTHQSRPFHVMIGGGDQIYNDSCMRRTRLFQDWLMIKNPLHKHNAPFTAAMQDELETFYLHSYCTWFSHGLFGMANAQIPMVNMYDDHDIIDGFGSYPHHFMTSPVFSGLGNVAFKYYMLFQHQSVPEETETTEPSWTLGLQPGPYIHERSRSLFMHLGASIALLAVDSRTERTRDEVVREDTWKKIMDRCYAEIVKGKTQHLLVLLGVPIAYPRLVWLENILTSRLMDPIKALGKTGLLGNFLNRFDGGVEVLDDLDDHWTAKNHKQERSIVIEDLQDLAADKSVRVTILSGDVHLAAVGQFYSNPKLGIAKHKDFRYIPNIVSSAIVNTPPSDMLADILNKRNKVHHFDSETDEDMIPLFVHGVDGKPRNNKRLLPHRNWCSILEYVPGVTPPPTPPNMSEYDVTPQGTPPGTAGDGRGGLLRHLSQTAKTRGPAFRGPDGVAAPKRQQGVSRPPISSGLLRAFSRRRSVSEDHVGQIQDRRPSFLTRTLSGSGGGRGLGGLFRRSSSTKRRDDGGINGQWGSESDEEADEQVHDDQNYARPPGSPGQQQYRTGAPRAPGRLGLRGGGGDYSPDFDEFEHGDENAFTVRQSSVRRGNGSANTYDKPLPAAPMPHDTAPVMSGAASGYVPGRGAQHEDDHEHDFRPKPFHRTPTGLSVKQLRNAQDYAVDLEGGLDVCLNVEVSPKDPAGITVPYRLLVPRLWYEYEGEDPEPDAEAEDGEEGEEEEEAVEPEPQYRDEKPSGVRRFLSLARSSKSKS